MAAQTIHLIPDTNRLWTEEDGPPSISKSFIGTVKAMVGHHVVKVRVPELVFQELVAQRQRALRRQFESLTKAASAIEIMTGKSLIMADEAALSAQIADVFRGQMNELGYEIIQTPFQSIPWPEVVSDAINRLPPFENNKSEKGFRDAVIMHTVLHDAKTTENEENTYFIAGDKLLREATRTKNSKLGIFSDLQEFQGHLRLLEEKIDKDIALSLQTDAGLAFFTSKTNSGFFVDGVRSRLLHELSYKFNTFGEGDSTLVRVGDEEIKRATTSFIGQTVKGHYQWKTEMDFAVRFGSRIGYPSVEKTISVSVMWTARYEANKFTEFEFHSSAVERENSTPISEPPTPAPIYESRTSYIIEAARRQAMLSSAIAEHQASRLRIADLFESAAGASSVIEEARKQAFRLADLIESNTATSVIEEARRQAMLISTITEQQSSYLKFADLLDSSSATASIIEHARREAMLTSAAAEAARKHLDAASILPTPD